MTMCVCCELSHPMPELTTLVNVKKQMGTILKKSVRE